jgi:CubicO group peptidase (beta-lactamase class C family)
MLLSAARAQDLPQATPQEVGLSADKLDRIQSIVQAAVDKNQTAGAVVLVARRGKIARWEAFGKMDLKTGAAMRPDAIFRIYSMTKPITTVAALLLVEEGKCKLDDPVSQYLPEFKGLRVFRDKEGETVETRREMTIRDLMRHTSGLTYGLPNGTPVDKLYIENKIEDSGDDLADMVRKLGKLPLQYQPGTQFNYSVSTDVLGRIIEVVSGQPLDKFLQDRIFRPLDMHDTGFVVPEEKLDRFATSYRSGEKGTLIAIDTPATSPYRTLAGFRLPGLGFGLGVSVQLDAKTSKPDPAAGEYGWSGAASTYFWVAPREKLIVIILQQLDPFNYDLQMALKPAIYAAIVN